MPNYIPPASVCQEPRSDFLQEMVIHANFYGDVPVYLRLSY